MKKIKAYRQILDRSFPGPVMDYFYFTEVDGRLWKADIEDESAEGWGSDFVWDDDPCGCSVNDDEMQETIKNSTVIGYIDEDHKFIVTKRWRVPTGYGYLNGKTIITSTEMMGRV